MSDQNTHRKRDIFVEDAIAPAFVAESIAKHATRHDIGAHEIFLGQVRADAVVTSSNASSVDHRSRGDRGIEKRQQVSAIEYTAYREMANEQMTCIREEAFTKWPTMTCLHVHHSLGTINAGELCFMVFASAPHRQQAREAVAFVTDEVKKRLPIFGKEILSEGGHVWKTNSK